MRSLHSGSRSCNLATLFRRISSQPCGTNWGGINRAAKRLVAQRFGKWFRWHASSPAGLGGMREAAPQRGDRLAIASSSLRPRPSTRIRHHTVLVLLANDAQLRRICGWESPLVSAPRSDPFSRAFDEFAKDALPHSCMRR